jgi:hypothetical protein
MMGPDPTVIERMQEEFLLPLTLGREISLHFLLIFCQFPERAQTLEMVFNKVSASFAMRIFFFQR